MINAAKLRQITALVDRIHLVFHLESTAMSDPHQANMIIPARGSAEGMAGPIVSRSGVILEHVLSYLRVLIRMHAEDPARGVFIVTTDGGLFHCHANPGRCVVVR